MEAIPRDRRSVVAAVTAVVLVGPTLPWMFESRHADSLHLRRAGAWIRDRDPDAPRIYTLRHRVTYYADGVDLPATPSDRARTVLDQARRGRADWLVFEKSRKLRYAPTFFADLAGAVREGESLTHVHEVDGRTVIYRARWQAERSEGEMEGRREGETG